MAKDKYVNYSMHAFGLLSLVLFMQNGIEATTFTVGGSSGWSVPSSNSPVYNQWAEKMRFQIGDSLLFVYAPASDSVLRVKKEDYDSCNTNSPLEKYTDGHTEFKFKQSGPYYFISGNKDNCQKYEKLLVVVMADRGKKNVGASPPAPLPQMPAPAPVPATAVPAPSPPPTATGGGEAPSTESNPPGKSGAASFVMSFVGSIGAFVGSSLLLAF